VSVRHGSITGSASSDKMCGKTTNDFNNLPYKLAPSFVSMVPESTVIKLIHGNNEADDHVTESDSGPRILSPANSSLWYLSINLHLSFYPFQSIPEMQKMIDIVGEFYYHYQVCFHAEMTSSIQLRRRSQLLTRMRMMMMMMT
jgi:hypothetical protein